MSSGIEELGQPNDRHSRPTEPYLSGNPEVVAAGAQISPGSLKPTDVNALKMLALENGLRAPDDDIVGSPHPASAAMNPELREGAPVIAPPEAAAFPLMDEVARERSLPCAPPAFATPEIAPLTKDVQIKALLALTKTKSPETTSSKPSFSKKEVREIITKARKGAALHLPNGETTFYDIQASHVLAFGKHLSQEGRKMFLEEILPNLEPKELLRLFLGDFETFEDRSKLSQALKVFTDGAIGTVHLHLKITQDGLPKLVVFKMAKVHRRKKPNRNPNPNPDSNPSQQRHYLASFNMILAYYTHKEHQQEFDPTFQGKPVPVLSSSPSNQLATPADDDILSSDGISADSSRDSDSSPAQTQRSAAQALLGDSTSDLPQVKTFVDDEKITIAARPQPHKDPSDRETRGTIVSGDKTPNNPPAHGDHENLSPNLQSLNPTVQPPSNIQQLIAASAKNDEKVFVQAPETTSAEKIKRLSEDLADNLVLLARKSFERTLLGLNDPDNSRSQEIDILDLDIGVLLQTISRIRASIAALQGDSSSSSGMLPWLEHKPLVEAIGQEISVAETIQRFQKNGKLDKFPEILGVIKEFQTGFYSEYVPGLRDMEEALIDPEISNSAILRCLADHLDTLAELHEGMKQDNANNTRYLYLDTKLENLMVQKMKDGSYQARIVDFGGIVSFEEFRQTFLARGFAINEHGRVYSSKMLNQAELETILTCDSTSLEGIHANGITKYTTGFRSYAAALLGIIPPERVNYYSMGVVLDIALKTRKINFKDRQKIINGLKSYNPDDVAYKFIDQIGGIRGIAEMLRTLANGIEN